MARFVDILAQAARDIMPHATVQITGPTHLQITTREGRQFFSDGSQAQFETQGMTEPEIYTRCVQFIRSTVDAAEFPDQAPLDRLFPVVRPVSFVNSPQTAELAQRRAGEFFNAHLAIDNEDGFQLVSNDLLASWGLTFEQAMTQALSNLRSLGIAAEVIEAFVTPAKALQFSEPYGYQTSWALDPDAVRSLIQDDTQPVLFFLPNRSEMMVALDHRSSLGWLQEHAKEIYDTHSRPMSPCALQFAQDGTIELWRPDVDHPGFELQQKAIATFISDQYQGITRPDGTTPTATKGSMAPLEVRVIDGRWVTVTIVGWDWFTSEDDRLVLPKTDYIGFANRDGESRVCRWGDAEEVLGPFARMEQMRPACYALSGFPTGDEWRALPDLVSGIDAASAYDDYDEAALEQEVLDDELDGSEIEYRSVPWETLLPTVANTVSLFGHPKRLNVLGQILTTHHYGQLLVNEGAGLRLATMLDRMAWDLDADRAALWARACDNLRALMHNGVFGWRDLNGVQILAAQFPPGHEAVWLTTPDVLRAQTSFQDQAGESSDPVIFAPTLDSLMIVPAIRPDEISAALAEARRLYDQSDEAITPAPFTLDEQGGLVPWWGTEYPELKHDILRASAVAAVDNYRRQADEYTSRKGRRWLKTMDAHMCPLTADGDGYTYTHYIEDDIDIAVLIPDCDNIVIRSAGQGEDDQVVVSFDAFKRVHGDYISVMEDLHPIRYYCNTFPSADDIAPMLEG